MQVSICCNVYNHSKYLEKCLKGFVIQETTFPYEVLIHDDASDDGSHLIIAKYCEQYPNLFRPIYQNTNQYSQGVNISHVYNWPRAKGKYLAICEGDDYWTDPMHLQRSVDYLEQNPDISLTCASFDILREGVVFDGKRYNSSFVFDKFDNRKWFTKTLTLVFKKTDELLLILKKYKRPVDTNLVYHLLSQGKGYCFKNVIGVYREHDKGVHSSLSELNKRKYTVGVYSDLFNHNHRDRYLSFELSGAILLYLVASVKSRNHAEFRKAIHLCLKYSREIIQNPKNMFLLKRIFLNRRK